MLISDEELMRLLLYYPQTNDRPDPLSDTLKNIVPDEDSSPDDIRRYWKIVDERVIIGEKVSDLEDYDLCRIYISPERRRAVFGNYLQATQGVEISILVHENYGTDGRILWISDKVNEILALERVEGIYGYLDFVKGDPWVAPIQYQQYKLVFQYTSEKKR